VLPLYPFSRFMSSMLVVSLWRTTFMTMANPTATSVAATTIAISTKNLPIDLQEVIGQGREGQVNRVEHHLDAHEMMRTFRRTRTPNAPMVNRMALRIR